MPRRRGRSRSSTRRSAEPERRESITRRFCARHRGMRPAEPWESTLPSSPRGAVRHVCRSAPGRAHSPFRAWTVNGTAVNDEARGLPWGDRTLSQSALCVLLTPSRSNPYAGNSPRAKVSFIRGLSTHISIADILSTPSPSDRLEKRARASAQVWSERSLSRGRFFNVSSGFLRDFPMGSPSMPRARRVK